MTFQTNNNSTSRGGFRRSGLTGGNSQSYSDRLLSSPELRLTQNTVKLSSTMAVLLNDIADVNAAGRSASFSDEKRSETAFFLEFRELIRFADDGGWEVTELGAASLYAGGHRMTKEMHEQLHAPVKSDTNPMRIVA
ncbi:hypothetical protein [Leifsonia sp. Leaf264]|uniref:hypothetical protein n=1 Tax=Leifsonia sp. Leaf264 TaxID=1736314 RepID=UPI0006F9EE4E|nr:hypothetical protein [Leifsonia sp. Leaf264]KQO98171.1 hypothetical protein ASF30_08915 [Leifsonia sp. Leaf264]